MINKRKILPAVVFVICLWFILAKAGPFLIYQDKIEPADAILVLGGGRVERIAQGIELYKNKYGPLLMFTGEWNESRLLNRNNWALMAQYIAVSHYKFPKNKIILILNPRSTYDDAVQSKAVCIQRNFKSLIVTSEPFHTRRAYLTFKKVYRDSGIHVMFYPVQNSWYTSKNWWKSLHGLEKTGEEYVKLAYYLCLGRLI